MVVTLYGIKNCDTIRKARNWLKTNNIQYRFHDYRTDGIEQGDLVIWCQQLGWEQLLNKRGTTFRQLDEQQKNNIDQEKAISLMLAQPAMIKRPLLNINDQYYLGFKPDIYADLFTQ